MVGSGAALFGRDAVAGHDLERCWNKRNSKSSSGAAQRLRPGAIEPSWWTGIYLRYPAQRFATGAQRRIAGGGGRAGRRSVRGAGLACGGFGKHSKTMKSCWTRLWKRGLETVELIVSDGLTAIVGAAQTVYPADRQQRCLAHRLRKLGSADATIGLVRAAQTPAGVLVGFLGRGKPSAGAGLGAAILRAPALGRAGDGRELPIRTGTGPGVLRLPSALATSPTHDQPGRRLVQTFAPLIRAASPDAVKRRTQPAGSLGRLLAGSRIDASMRNSISRSNPSIAST